MSRRLMLGLLLVVGCGKPKVDVTPDPAPTPQPSVVASASASASAIPSVSASSALSEAVGVLGACHDGKLTGYPSDTGLLGPDAGGAWGDGIGLGTVGGFGGRTKGPGIGYAPSRVVVAGSVAKVTGPRAKAITTELCTLTPKIRKCYDDARVANPKAAGTLEIGLDVLASGAVTATIEKGTLDPIMQECVRSVIAGVSLPGGATKATYTLSFNVPLKAVTMKEVGATITGRLPPEVIKRIVRANFPRLRACYETGLKKDPKLAGKVAVKLVIDSTGAVESAKEEPGATLADAAVRSCVVGVFRTLSFPEPEGGKVLVTYPIDFQNGE